MLRTVRLLVSLFPLKSLVTWFAPEYRSIIYNLVLYRERRKWGTCSFMIPEAIPITVLFVTLWTLAFCHPRQLALLARKICWHRSFCWHRKFVGIEIIFLGTEIILLALKLFCWCGKFMCPGTKISKYLFANAFTSTRLYPHGDL